MSGVKRTITGIPNILLPPSMSLPSFLIIGAQKAATTSLFDILTKHPNISGSKIKETHYFDWESKYSKGPNFYKTFFKFNFKNKLLFEATPEYLYRSYVPDRVFKLFGTKIKLIICLRDPLSRAVSSYNMYRDMRQSAIIKDKFKNRQLRHPEYQIYSKLLEPKAIPSFDKIVQQELNWYTSDENIIEPSIIRRGFYQNQIERWLKFFPIENFFFLDMNSLKTEGQSMYIIGNIEEFLGVEKGILGANEITHSHKRTYDKNIVTNDVKYKLLDIFYEENKDLREITNLDLNWEIYNIN